MATSLFRRLAGGGLVAVVTLAVAWSALDLLRPKTLKGGGSWGAAIGADALLTVHYAGDGIKAQSVLVLVSQRSLYNLVECGQTYEDAEFIAIPTGRTVIACLWIPRASVFRAAGREYSLKTSCVFLCSEKGLEQVLDVDPSVVDEVRGACARPTGTPADMASRLVHKLCTSAPAVARFLSVRPE